MGLIIYNLTQQPIPLSSPLDGILFSRTSRTFPHIEYDKTVNDVRYSALLRSQQVKIKSLDSTSYVSLWNQEPKLRLGGYVYWVDATGALRQKVGDPTFDLDGTVIGPGSGIAKNQFLVDGLITTAMSQYQAGYISANNTISPTDCSAATGTFQTATFCGVYAGVSGEMVQGGKIEVQFDGGLSPAPVAGNPANLSWINSGQFRNDAPDPKSENFLTKAGVILNASGYSTNQRCVIVIDTDVPIQRK